MDGKRKKIGLLTDRFYYRLPIDIFHGARKAAKELDLDIVVFSGSIINSSDTEKRQSNILFQLAHNHELDGLIICSNILSTEIDSEGLEEFCRQFAHVPVVSIGLPVKGIPCIVIDNYSGMYSIVNHLIREHHKEKIVFIAGPADNADARERLQAYLDACKNNKINTDMSLVLSGNFMENVAAEIMHNYIAEKGKTPGVDFDAVVGVNDFSARGAFLELQRIGISIPEDVAIAGFDDVNGMENLSPPLTTVTVSFSKMGESAVRILSECFCGGKLLDVYKTKTEPVIRESCGCEPAGLKENNSPESGNSWNDPVKAIHNSVKKEIEKQYSEGVDFDFYSELWESIGESAGEYYRRMIFSMYYSRLSQYLANTVNIREITDILYQNLPQIGVRTCCIALYDTPPEFSFPQKLPARSRLVMALVGKSEYYIPEEGIPFNTLDILPAEMKNDFDYNVMIIESLFFREQQIGFIVYAAEHSNDRIYTDMRILISNSLQTALLFEKVRKNEKDLSDANSRIMELNKKLSKENMQMHAEMKVAERIQTALVPSDFTDVHRAFEICGKMLPADEVGGDYFDIIRISDDCFWVGIGDVSGHGLTAGLFMMMAQTMNSLVTRNYQVTPKDALEMMNGVLLDNIGNRLKESNFMTFTSLKHLGDGRFQYAGLHQDIIILSGKTGKCRLVPTNGVWLNLMSDISKETINEQLEIEKGDIMVLHTDGITELFDKEKKMFGLDNLCRVIEEHAALSAEQIIEHVFSRAMSWSNGIIKDDMTILVLKRR